MMARLTRVDFGIAFPQNTTTTMSAEQASTAPPPAAEAVPEVGDKRKADAEVEEEDEAKK